MVAQVNTSVYLRRHSSSREAHSFEARFEEYLTRELELLSSPLWEWGAGSTPVAIHGVLSNFSTSTAGENVHCITISPDDFVNASFLKQWRESTEGDRAANDVLIELEKSAPYGFNFIGDVLWQADVRNFIREFARPSSAFHRSPACFPDAWMDGAETFHNKREEASNEALCSTAQSATLAEKCRDPISRRIESAFHKRFIQRRIDQTLVLS